MYNADKAKDGKLDIKAEHHSGWMSRCVSRCKLLGKAVRLSICLLVLITLGQQAALAQTNAEKCWDVDFIALRSDFNGNIVRAGITANTYLGAASPHILGWEMFRLIKLSGDEVALQSDLNKRFVHAESGIDGRLAAVSDRVTNAEIFTLIQLDEGRIALRAKLNNLYVSADNGPDGYMSATSSAIGDAERFELIPLETEQTLPYPLLGYSTVGNVGMSTAGNLFVTGGADGKLTLWDPESCSIQEELVGHTQPAGAIFNHTGTQLASGSQDSNILLWDLESGTSIPLTNHTHWIYGLAFSPDDNYLVSSSSDQTMYRWDLSNLSALPGEFTGGHSTGVASLAIHPDPERQLVASGGNDGNAVLWQLDTLAPIATLRGHTDAIYGIDFSPDGRYLATGSWDTTIKLWDVESRELVRTLNGHTWHVRSVQFSANGKMLVSAGADSTIRLWRVATGEEVSPNMLEHPNTVVDGVVFTPDDQGVISADRKNNLFYWDISAYALKPDVNIEHTSYTTTENIGQITVPVVLDAKAISPVTINYIVEDGSAQKGVEYQAANGVLTIPAGERKATITIDIIDDCGTPDSKEAACVSELDKDFAVEILSSSDNVEIGERKRATVTIIDDDYIVVLDDESGKLVERAEVALYRNGKLESTKEIDEEGHVRFKSFELNDRLIALSPQELDNSIHEGQPFRAYLTSMNILTDTGIAPEEVAQLQPISMPGKQILTVKRENTLILFDLVVSLEWETSGKGDLFLDDLIAALNTGSAYLYDVTDGQFAFGAIEIYDGGERWNDADFQVLASNQVRPHAVPCGIAANDGPGFFRMGRVWNRYGDINSEDKKDFPSLRKPDGFRALVHEFLHYAFCLHDQYFEIDDSGILKSAFCVQDLRNQPQNEHEDESAASVMYWPYTTSELDMEGSLDWNEACRETQQWQENQQSSWETIEERFKDERWTIKKPPLGGSPNPGPDIMPVLDWLTTVKEYLGDEQRSANTPETRKFRVIHSNGSLPYEGDVDIYLHRQGDIGVALSIDQGSADTRDGLIDVMGVSDDDTVLAITWNGSHFATKSVNSTNNRIKLANADWTPVITARPEIDEAGTPTGITLNIAQAEPVTGTLRATLIPIGGKAVDDISLLQEGSGRYSGSFQFPIGNPFDEAHLWIREIDPSTGNIVRQTVTTYTIGGSPGSHERSYVPSTSDGNCSLFFDEDSFAPEIRDKAEVIVLPSRGIPPGTVFRNVISPSCYLGVPREVTDLALSGQQVMTGTLILYYNRVNMQGVDPDLLQIYRLVEDGPDAVWKAMDSTHDEQNQLVSAKIEQFGLYVLVEENRPTDFVLATSDETGDEVTNILPVRQVESSIPITEALSSCINELSAVYTVDENAPNDGIRKYVVDVPDYVNDLQLYQPEQTYYAIMNEECVFTYTPETQTVSSAERRIAEPIPAQTLSKGFFPAGFYGTITHDGSTIDAGTVISVQIDGVTYAETQSFIIDGQSVYTVDVPADDLETSEIEGGQAGQMVTILVNGKATQQAQVWQAGVTTQANLEIEKPLDSLFLPLVTQ